MGINSVLGGHEIHPCRTLVSGPAWHGQIIQTGAFPVVNAPGSAPAAIVGERPPEERKCAYRRTLLGKAAEKRGKMCIFV